MLRVFLRAPAILAVTLLSYLGIVASLPLRRFAAARQLRLRNAIFRAWARLCARIVGLRVEVEGVPPRGGFLLVSNHVSYMDVILLATRLDAAFVAKADLRGWPVLGRAFAVADTIFIDRSRRRDVLRVMEQVGRELDRGLGVVIFPEGTSGKGDGILRFKPSLLDYAARRDLPVHFVALSYATPDGYGPPSRLVCWWGDAPFLPHFLELLRLPSFQARLVFGEAPVHDGDRKALAGALRGAVAERFAPMP
jgi:1-acyl-sn-glycerol-3-phosphate acyltransferase